MHTSKLFVVISAVILSLSSVAIALNCDAVNVKLKSLNYCQGVEKQVITLFDNITFRVSKNCEFLVKSCVLVTPYNTGKMEVAFFKGKSRLVKESIDLCNKDKKLKEMTQVLIDSMGIQLGCPVTKFTANNCNKERILRTFSPMGLNAVKTLLGGTPEPVKLVFNIDHDTGKTCFETLITYTGIPKRG